jgi:hypothetical protein
MIHARTVVPREADDRQHGGATRYVRSGPRLHAGEEPWVGAESEADDSTVEARTAGNDGGSRLRAAVLRGRGVASHVSRIRIWRSGSVRIGASSA